MARALAYAVVIIPAEEVDVRGLHVCNLAGMRRALAALSPSPDYVLTDGFGVDGLGVPGLAVWKGDQVAACVAAASVVAKVTRDRIMVELDDEYPGYGFAEHKGYVTDEHSAALAPSRTVPGAPVLVRERGRGDASCGSRVGAAATAEYRQRGGRRIADTPDANERGWGGVSLGGRGRQGREGRTG